MIWDHLRHQPLEQVDLDISLPVKGLNVHTGLHGSGDLRLSFEGPFGRISIVGTTEEIRALCQQISELGTRA